MGRGGCAGEGGTSLGDGCGLVQRGRVERAGLAHWRIRHAKDLNAASAAKVRLLSAKSSASGPDAALRVERTTSSTSDTFVRLTLAQTRAGQAHGLQQAAISKGPAVRALRPRRMRSRSLAGDEGRQREIAGTRGPPEDTPWGGSCRRVGRTQDVCGSSKATADHPMAPQSEGAVGLMENGVARIEAEDSLSGGSATTLTGRRESNVDGDAPLGGERSRRPMDIGSVNVTAKDLERMEGATRRSFRS
jgi:hypothetical protein